ncbi:MAG: histidine kinase [Candidatus Omnitrophica bacterium]|nr:histidine kinase [Candidatus Omnitrophota bacterium]
MCGFFLSEKVFAETVTKREVLEKYERVIVQSNQMNLYGYDLSEVTFKLKRLTEVLIANRFDQADKLLDEIKGDLKAIEARGPERLKRERRLAWVEIFADFIQQFALFVVIALVLLRLDVVRANILRKASSGSQWKLISVFTGASILGGLIGLIRYGQSSWAFVDLQILFVGISGLVGGIWVGGMTALFNALFRLTVVPGFNVYLVIPLVTGVAAGLFRFHRLRDSASAVEMFWGGLGIGVLHSLFMYLPIFSYLPLPSFALAVSSLSVTEGIMVFLFFVAAWQIFKEQRRKETEKELFRTRLQFLQAQINPHFLFNALNTISAICGEEHAERARKLIVELSTLFRRMTKQESDLVPLKDELEYVDAYLNIEQARFGERLAIEKNIGLSAHSLEMPIPILVIQPIVENAVKHGISKKSEGGKLTLNAKEEDSMVIIEVKDTGVGMPEDFKAKAMNLRREDETTDQDHAGVGLANIRERLSRFYGNRSHITVSSALNKGTTVTLSFPKAS